MNNDPHETIYDSYEEDPLVSFTCLNDYCEHPFTPEIILIEGKKEMIFFCPLCRSKYVATYEIIPYSADFYSISIIDGPILLEIGNKVVSA